MDTLTHALSGALLARATAPRAPRAGTPRLRARLVAGAAAAAFPDIDVVVGFLSPVAYLETHRGVTHSVLLLPLWALLLAWVFARIARDRDGYVNWYDVAALGIAAHIAGDLITSFGTMILEPVTNERFALGTTFIIDLWFSAIIVAGLVASLVWRHSRSPAVVASIVLVAYVGMQAVAKSEAERFGEAYARANGNPAARVAAEPRPVSPFNWTVFVANGNEVSYAHVNVRRTRPRSVAADAGFLARLDAAYRPLDVAQWQRRTRFGATPEEQALARSAWNASALSFFRWFAELPVLDGISAAGHCVWFRDLRFDTPGRTSLPFRYGVCRDGPDDRWQLHASASDGSAAEARR